MNHLRIILIIIAAALCTAAAAPRRQSTIAKGLKPAAQTVPSTARIDTLTSPAASAVRIDGYQKVLRAYRESMFVDNLTPDTLVGVSLELTYTTPAGEQLHKRRKDVECTVPPGERRNITIPSWDTQRQFYYVGAPRPKRAKGSPYAVSIKIVAAYFNHNTARGV